MCFDNYAFDKRKLTSLAGDDSGDSERNPIDSERVPFDPEGVRVDGESVPVEGEGEREELEGVRGEEYYRRSEIDSVLQVQFNK